jgi:23S rRNA pseudouridine2605 synthase
MKSRHVPLGRALSKLGILSRTQAGVAIRAGRVHVNGRIVRDQSTPVDPKRVRIALDDEPTTRAPWRTIVFHKPRGVVTTRSDPEGRRTIYNVVGEQARGLIAVGRLDLATSGLLLLTTDTRLADWITNPSNGIPRVYIVTVRGRLDETVLLRLVAGIAGLRAHAATLRKSSSRESHLTIELREGKNREVRRLFEAIGHEVTRLKRVALGGLELGTLEPGQWRELSREEVRAAFPAAPLNRVDASPSRAPTPARARAGSPRASTAPPRPPSRPPSQPVRAGSSCSATSPVASKGAATRTTARRSR